MGRSETGATGFCRPSDASDRRPRHSRDSDHCSSSLYSTRGAEPKFIVFPRRACGNSLEHKYAQTQNTQIWLGTFSALADPVTKPFRHTITFVVRLLDVSGLRKYTKYYCQRITEEKVGGLDCRSSLIGGQHS